jgi:CheY-like chemotaxis protein
MKSVKAVAIKEPWASRIAAGQETVAFKGSRTSYRGQILIVAPADPHTGPAGYAIALAELTGCRPLSDADRESAHMKQGYVWEFSNITPLQRYSLAPRSGLFTATVPEGALPAESQTPLEALPPRPAERSDSSLKVMIASEIRSARVCLTKASGGLADLARGESEEPPAPGAISYGAMKAAFEEFRINIERLIYEMIRTDPTWRRQLAPWTNNEEWQMRSSSATELPRSKTGVRLDVLLVDDEQKMARGLQRSLRGQHDVRLAHSKAEALDQMRSKVPDVLLCDYQLDMQTTEDLLELVSREYPGVRRVLYSFSRIETWCDLLQRKLIDTAVPKSARQDELLAALG